MDKRLRVGIGFSIAFAILLLFLAVYPDAASKQWALNLLLCLFGSLLGWFAGFMAAPYDNEKDAFLSIGKAITAFLSGNSSSAAGTILKLAAIGVSKVPQ